MTIERVEDLKEPPVVGRYYMVPCVAVSGAQQIPPGLYPITGPKHEDAEHVNFPWQHWHFDFRFLSDAQMKWARRGRLGRSEYALVLNTEFGLGRQIYQREGTFAAPVHRRRKCMREPASYPAVHAKFLPALEAAYADKRVTCGKCPHRGLPLESLPKDADGNTVCVGHGLKWDLSTGKMVRR